MNIEQTLTRLRRDVGQEVHVGPWLKIKQSDINLFAQATGDFQWIHVDPEEARVRSPYKTTVAHGYFILGLLPQLTEFMKLPVLADENEKIIINYGLNKVRFPAPVPVDSEIRARTILTDVINKTQSIEILRTVTIEIKGHSKPACVGEIITRVAFKSREDH